MCCFVNRGQVTRFVVNPNATLSQVLMRIRPGVTNYYVYGLGLLYKVRETATSTDTLTYHYDLRGSTVALTDLGGNLTDRIEYSPYGLITYRAGTNDTPFLFNGRYGVQTDPNGLLYMRARYYNPYICRFLNPDPIGFAGGLNFYAYADGNPVSLIDPFGLCTEDEGFWSWVAGAGMGVLNTVAGIASMASGADLARSAMIGMELYVKYGASGYYAQYGGWNTALMIAGEFAGTTPFAEGVIGYEIGWGTPLSSFESGQRTVSGSLTMAGTALALYGGARGLSTPATTTATADASALITVSRWGRPGLQPGDWVMKGPPTFWNCLMSGKYQPSLVPTFGEPPNIPAPFSAGESFTVPASSLQIPPGFWGSIKGVLRQRIYQP